MIVVILATRIWQVSLLSSQQAADLLAELYLHRFHSAVWSFLKPHNCFLSINIFNEQLQYTYQHSFCISPINISAINITSINTPAINTLSINISTFYITSINISMFNIPSINTKSSLQSTFLSSSNILQYSFKTIWVFCDFQWLKTSTCPLITHIRMISIIQNKMTCANFNILTNDSCVMDKYNTYDRCLKMTNWKSTVDLKSFGLWQITLYNII